jgi:DNA-binding transcriptional LysR family regulator
MDGGETGLATPHGAPPIIAIRPIRPPEVTRAIGIVERRKGGLSPAAKYFRDMLVADYSATTASQGRSSAKRHARG